MKKRIVGIVKAKAPAGGVIETYDERGEHDGTYYISNFDPLAGKLSIGTVVSFNPTNPGDHRNVAEKLKVLEKYKKSLRGEL